MPEQNEYAPGIPQKGYRGTPLETLKPDELVTYALQHHSTRRRPDEPHLDLRLGTPETNLFSWALPKARLPGLKEKLLAINTELHNYGYGRFQGTIGKGYGEGQVKLQDYGKALITHTSPKSLHFTLAHAKVPVRYRLLHLTDDKWLLTNTTPQGGDVKFDKPSFKLIAKQDLPGVIRHAQDIQEKIDGAHAIYKVDDTGKLEAYSPRKRVTGEPITYTEKLRLGDAKLPEYKDTEFRGEVYGEKTAAKQKDPKAELKAYLKTFLRKHYSGKSRALIDAAAKQAQLTDTSDLNMDTYLGHLRGNMRVAKDSLKIGKIKSAILHALHGVVPVEQTSHHYYEDEEKKAQQTIPFSELSGILNSTISNSLETQQAKKIALKNAIFRIVRFKGRDVTQDPIAKKREYIKELLRALPKDKFTEPKTLTPKETLPALQEMEAGKNPRTNEGLVIDQAMKYKIRPDATGYVMGLYPGLGKRQTTAGGLLYSDTPGGQAVGRIGTGFTDADIAEISANPDEFIGRPFRFEHQGKLTSGNYRAPSFKGWETDKPNIKVATMTKEEPTSMVPLCIIGPDGKEKATINTEVADSDAERKKGLSGRKDLAKTAGMLFTKSGAFWMKGVPFDIDILFLNKEGQILDIRTMSSESKRPDLPLYYTLAPAKYAFELLGGICKEAGIKVGDKVRLNSKAK